MTQISEWQSFIDPVALQLRQEARCWTKFTTEWKKPQHNSISKTTVVEIELSTYIAAGGRTLADMR